MEQLEHKSAPNEIVFQLDYKPRAKFLDVRGEWVDRIADAFGFKDWTMKENLVQVFDRTEFSAVQVGFNRAWAGMTDCLERNSVVERAAKLTDLMLGTSIFGPDLQVTRLYASQLKSARWASAIGEDG